MKQDGLPRPVNIETSAPGLMWSMPLLEEQSEYTEGEIALPRRPLLPKPVFRPQATARAKKGPAPFCFGAINRMDRSGCWRWTGCIFRRPRSHPRDGDAPSMAVIRLQAALAGDSTLVGDRA